MIRPIATLGLSNTSGIAILELDENYVTVAMHCGTGYKHIETCEILYTDYEYSNDLEPCFEYMGETWFLAEFIRTDY